MNPAALFKARSTALARAAALACAVAAALAACSTLHFPGVHRIIVQQGNVVTRTMIDKLKPGMSKNQVRYVMGNAVMENPFDANRWDYIYTADIRGQDYIERRLSIFFEDGRMVSMEGNYLDEEKTAKGEQAERKDKAISQVMEEQKSDTVAAEQKQAGDKD